MMGALVYLHNGPSKFIGNPLVFAKPINKQCFLMVFGEGVRRLPLDTPSSRPEEDAGWRIYLYPPPRFHVGPPPQKLESENVKKKHYGLKVFFFFNIPPRFRVGSPPLQQLDPK